MSLDHTRNDIVTRDNEFGYQQTYQLDGVDEMPVCTSCGCCVMTNQGQGSDCDKCQHEAELEMEHDYNEGRL